jgi:two-component system OmpR family sensor kinase
LVPSVRALEPKRPIEVRVPGSVTISGDEDRLRQAVTNLVANALSHTPPDAKIELEVRAEDGDAVIDVSDEGAGLDEEALQHAFERFWRADPNRSRSSGGVGLGLAIVDAIARAHRGSVSVENRPEGGARFSIRLPRDPQA